MATVVATAVKVTVNLRRDLATQLREWAESRGKTFTQALNEAIALKMFIEDVYRRKGKIIVEHEDGSQREVFFHSA